MSKQSIPWHRSHSKNAQFSDTDVAKVRPICKACAYGELRQTATDQHRVHRPMPTIPGQCFSIDAFTCKHVSIRGYKYCDLMRDNASQMIYCNSTKNRTADEIVRSLTDTWKLNPGWNIYDPSKPDVVNSRYIRMDPEISYQSDTVLSFVCAMGYKIERTPPRDKHAGGIAERMVGIVTAKTNTAMNGAPPSFWCWATFKATQDLNFSYCSKIDDSPYHYVTGYHIDIKYLHSFFAECYLFIPLKDRDSKLSARRAHRCRFLAYSYTTILVPTYVVIIVHDNGTYGPQRVSEDIIFDESCVFDKYIDNSPSDAEFQHLPYPSRISHLSFLYQTYQYHLKTCLSSIYHHLSSLLLLLYVCMSLRYIVTWSLTSLTLNLSHSP